MSKPIRRHFFVCTNQRPPTAKPSCGGQGSTQIYARIIEEMERKNLFGKVLITPTACLGPCSEGPIIVSYPDGVWYSNVKERDVEEIVESHMENGKPVERLLYTYPVY